MWDESQIPPKGLELNIKPKEEVPPELILQEQNIENNKLLQQAITQNNIMMLILVKLCKASNVDLSDIFKEMANKVKEDKKTKKE